MTDKPQTANRRTASWGVVILIPISFVIGAIEGGCEAVAKLLRESYDAGI